MTGRVTSSLPSSLPSACGSTRMNVTHVRRGTPTGPGLVSEHFRGPVPFPSLHTGRQVEGLRVWGRGFPRLQNRSAALFSWVLREAQQPLLL